MTTINNMTLFNGDCLEVLQTIETGSVNCVIADLPYGYLNKSNQYAQWDKEIELETLWPELLRVCKINAAIILFGQGLFSAKLMMSQPKLYRNSLVWDKINRPTGFLDARRKPLKIHEDILVFYRSLPTYNPQMTIGAMVHSRGKCGNGVGKAKNRCYGKFKQTEAVFTKEKYPNSICRFAKEHGKYQNPTQKPVALLEYLIKTYTNDGDCVLDCTMGSGSTMVAWSEHWAQRCRNRAYAGVLRHCSKESKRRYGATEIKFLTTLKTKNNYGHRSDDRRRVAEEDQEPPG